ncbi:probable transcription factor At1g61730 [Ziziphus jujuba]|uniref:GLABROUS1 enhancer-binding protein-like n=2 Tax=Ziziphus jujuba TaxID=326968 RepID=A0A978W1K2_ZIZJJ|nr:probable transcription factor At1g61730 [Ziziphus jujuba]KAH7545836.1 hypothetical protein FEM48_Zijuj01G0136000 [Ziziphus jujuba var. spinosa]
MAPKRPSPLDEPPAASSSEEEDASSGEEEEEEEASGSESGSEEEEEETEDPKTSVLPSNHAADKKAPSKKADPAAANSKPHSSSTGSESETESGSDTEPENTRRPTGAADPNVKPIASKPMEETSTAKKPRSKSNATPAARLPAKRPSGESEAKESKRAKKKGQEPEDEDEPGTASVAEEEQKKPGDEKKLFQRLWSEDDEIVILRGMIDYTAKKGADPSADMNAFHDFIKKSLQINVTKAQLADKVRRLKKKYENNAGKGKKYNPTKPHELKAFELSKKIWGGEGPSGGGGDEPKSNGKVRSNQKSNRSLALLKAELLSTPEPPKEAEKMEIDGNPGVSESLNEVVEFGKSLAVVGLPEHVVKKGLDLISGSKKAELEEKWKKLHVAELELYAKRTQLISEQAKLILDAYKRSSDH